MPDESKQNTHFQDHHGFEISRRMSFLDRTINDVLGANQKLGGIESFIEDCMRFVDDMSDGIADARHGTLHVWRPPAMRMPEGANRYEETDESENDNDPPEPPTSRPDPPNTGYFIKRIWEGETQEKGPLSEGKIKRNIKSGNIVRSDELRKGKDGSWKRAGTLKRFKDFFPPK